MRKIQLSTEINNLKELNRRLTGRIEELVNAQNQEKRNARTQYETLDKRLAVFEPQVVVIDGQSIEVSAEEKRPTIRQWRFCRPASTAMRRRRSRTSMTTSRSRPTGWMHFSGGVPVLLPMSTIKRQFHLKINCFENSSKGARAADAMMLVASSQAASGSINAAKATPAKIIKTYPKTDVAKEAAQRIREFDQKK